MKTQIEWVKNAIGLCLGSYALSKEQQVKIGEELKSLYMSYPKEIQDSIRELMKKQLELDDYIYVFSYFVKYMSTEDFERELMNAVIKKEYDWYTGSMIELQVTSEVKGQYGLRRLLHKQNIDNYEKCLKPQYDYIPADKRNRKRIVIATE